MHSVRRVDFILFIFFQRNYWIFWQYCITLGGDKEKRYMLYKYTFAINYFSDLLNKDHVI